MEKFIEQQYTSGDGYNMKSITEASLGDMQRIDNYFKEVQKMQIYVPLNTQRIDIEELDR